MNLEFFKKLKFRKIVIITGIFLVIFFAVFFYSVYSENKSVEKIGWVTDIHADRFKRRTVDSGTLYPKKYKEYLPKVFDAMQSDGIDIVISTGDNTNSGDDNYAVDLAKITKEKKMNIIWVRGNHDNDEVMEILGIKEKQYYYKDFSMTRILVLDTTEYPNGEYDYLGGISDKQMNWIKESLKTDKKVIVAMHMPIFEQNIESINVQDLKGEFYEVGDVLERYIELEKIFQEAGNVKLVLSGHWHMPWHKEYNGVNYYGQAALTRKGEEGAYTIIDLNNFQVDYKFAK